MSAALHSAALRLMVALCLLSACSDSPPQPEASGAGGVSARTAGPTVQITRIPARDTLAFGEVMQLGALAVGADGAPLPDQSPTWTSSDSLVVSVNDAGIAMAGQREGTARITARVGAVEAQRLLTVRARRADSATTDEAPLGDGAIPGETSGTNASWTFCAEVGSNCEFLGLRVVRLVFASGTIAQQSAYGRIACGVDAFGDPDPAAGRALRCEYGPMKRRVLRNPMPGAFGMGASAIVPAGASGSSAERLQPIAPSGATPDGSGVFRTRCDPTDFQFNDPLANPGRANASPLHIFFGNAAVGANSTAATVARSGASTCRGGVLDRSVYYVPALVDTRTGEVQVPADGVMYYRTGDNIEPVTVQAMPTGLVMMAGDRNARGVQARVVEWLCRDRFVTNSGMIPECAVGDQVQLWVHFPQCWDGVNLDSRDHRSHMAYPVSRQGADRSTCPPSHPVVLPQLSQVLQFNVRAGASLATWRLTTDVYGSGLRGGLSAHAHWINGWAPRAMRTMVSECLNRGANCSTSSLGNGTALF